MSNSLIDAASLSKILETTASKIRLFEENAAQIKENFKGDCNRHAEYVYLQAKIETYRSIKEDTQSLLSVHRKMVNENTFIDQFIATHPHFASSKAVGQEKYDQVVSSLGYLEAHRKRIYRNIFNKIEKRRENMRALATGKLASNEYIALEIATNNAQRYISEQMRKLPSIRRTMYRSLFGLPSRKLYFELMAIHAHEMKERDIAEACG